MQKWIKKPIHVFTPVNPRRPWYERLSDLHHFNVQQNPAGLYDYSEMDLSLPVGLQKHGLWRGNNVIYGFNKTYLQNKDSYSYICKWDDDMVLPPNILQRCHRILEADKDVVGCGLFQEDYGFPNILMQQQRELGFRGAFQRFYVYRMDAWSLVPINETLLDYIDPLKQETVGWPRRSGVSGDPDHDFQRGLEGKKVVLDVPSIHLDHRAFSPIVRITGQAETGKDGYFALRDEDNELWYNNPFPEYRVLVDIVRMFWMSMYAKED